MRTQTRKAKKCEKKNEQQVARIFPFFSKIFCSSPHPSVHCRVKIFYFSFFFFLPLHVRRPYWGWVQYIVKRRIKTVFCVVMAHARSCHIHKRNKEGIQQEEGKKNYFFFFFFFLSYHTHTDRHTHTKNVI